MEWPDVSQVGATTFFEIFNGLRGQFIKLARGHVGFELCVPSLGIQGRDPVAHLGELLGWELLDSRFYFRNAHKNNYTMRRLNRP